MLCVKAIQKRDAVIRNEGMQMLQIARRSKSENAMVMPNDIRARRIKRTDA